jgi:hypothetical protein
MVKPTFADYVRLVYTLFDQFAQQRATPAGPGHPFVYQHQVMIVFFVIMQFKRIFQFETQHTWLEAHPDRLKELGFPAQPHRTTLSRRYKALYYLLQDFIAFLGQYAEALASAFNRENLYEDKSLFKAQGPVWHQSDRQAERIPEGLRHLDTEATWSKSAYHGWVYGYGVHLTCTHSGFPELVQVETASVSESQVIDEKAPQIIQAVTPSTLTADNSYTQALRIRQWAQQGVALLTPALQWVKGRYAEAYHHFLEAPENAPLLAQRRTAIEPVFDLIAKTVGATDNHKQLPIQHLANVRTCLTLATLTVQLAMIANSIWGLPLHNISAMMAAFT